MSKYLLLLLLFLLLSSCGNKEYKRVQINYKYIITNYSKEKSSLWVRLPIDYKHRQSIRRITYSQKPNKIIREEFSKVMYFEVLPDINEIQIDLTLDIYKYDYFNAENKNSVDDLNRYLLFDASDVLLKWASQLKSQSEVDTINNIIDHSLNVITYEIQDNEKGWQSAVLTGKGDCTEFTDLFIQLCRINGIPARSVLGYLTGSKIYDWGYNNHQWAEVYLEEKGWIPVETIGNEGLLKSFPIRQENRYIYIDRHIDLSNSFHYAFSDKVNVDEEISMKYVK